MFVQTPSHTGVICVLNDRSQHLSCIEQTLCGSNRNYTTMVTSTDFNLQYPKSLLQDPFSLILSWPLSYLSPFTFICRFQLLGSKKKFKETLLLQKCGQTCLLLFLPLDVDLDLLRISRKGGNQGNQSCPISS